MQQVDIDNLKEDDLLIALMGPTGTGKTSFIHSAARTDFGIGHDLLSQTVEMRAFRIRVPEENADIVLVDMPGFDDTHRSDYEILEAVSNWLKEIDVKNLRLHGILYFHRISDNRMAGTPLRNLELFQKICGPQWFHRVVFVTTMWDELWDPEVGERRETELCQTFWAGMLARGSRTARYNHSHESAWSILDSVRDDFGKYIKKPKLKPRLQKELVDEGRILSGTGAGRKLYEQINELQRQRNVLIRQITKQIDRPGTDDEARELLRDQRYQLEMENEATIGELARLELGLLESWGTKLKSLFPVDDMKQLTKERPREKEREKEREKKKEVGRLSELERQERKRLENEMKQLTKVRAKERENERKKEREVERLTERERRERRRLEREKERQTKKAAHLERLLESLGSKSSTSLSSTSDLSCASAFGDHEDLNDYERSKFAEEICALVSELADISGKYQYHLLTRLEGAVAQSIIDFLNQVLDQGTLKLDERKRLMHLLHRFAKSAQVFPRCFRLKGVECNLIRPADEGGFGCIYKGTFRDQAVCVKTVRVYQGGANNLALRAQAAELVLLANISHPNVLPFYGLYRSKEKISRICLVSPWMEGGNLVNYLKEFPASPRILLLLDIASGLNYLHELGIIHSDLKARNVLVSGEQAVLADFGISRIAMTQVTTTGAGMSYTANWTAPELFTARSKPVSTRASDMWSFGCICYEVMTGDIPFAQYHHEYQLILALKNDQVTPSRPDTDGGPGALEGSPGWLRVLAERCWDFNPEGRPTAGEVQRLISAQLEGKDDRPVRDDGFPRLLTAERAERANRKIDHGLIHAVLQRVLGDFRKENEHRTVIEQAILANEGQSWLVSRRRQICQVVEHSVLTSRFPFA